MSQFEYEPCLCAVDSGVTNKVPLNPDGTLSLETLRVLYPRAIGLVYTDTKTPTAKRTADSEQTRRLVLINDGKLSPPPRGWSNSVYTVLCDASVPPLPQKRRKSDQRPMQKPKVQKTEEPPMKKPKVEKTKEPPRQKPKVEKTEEPPMQKPKFEKRTFAPEGDLPETVRLRQRGNDSYLNSRGTKDYDMKLRHLRTACNLYRQSLNCAQFKDQECAALKNLGKAGWRLASTYMESGSEAGVDSSTVSGVFSEAIRALTKALQLGTEIKKPNDWLVDVDSSIQQCFRGLKDFLINWLRVFDDQSRFLLELITSSCHSPIWKGRMYLELARTHLKSAIVNMNEGQQQCGFAHALHQIRECHFPIEEARRLLKSQADLENLKQVETDVSANNSAAEALQAMRSGDVLLTKVLQQQGGGFSMDGIHMVLDKYRQAMGLLKGQNHVEYEAIAHSKLGKLYSDVLKLKDRGKEYFTQCIRLAKTLSPRNFVGQAWFDAAARALKEIHQTQRDREDEKWRKARDPYLKELSKELKDLEKLDRVEDLIEILPTKFPAKHRQKNDMLNLKKGEDLSQRDRGEIKKLLQKLILLYHPDHVDREKHGFKYYVLCEEITKVLTNKYERFMSVFGSAA